MTGMDAKVKPARSLRDRIALAIRRDALQGISAESTADAIVHLLDEEAAESCRDGDCARVLPHSRLSAHLWRHEAEPPFDRALFRWLCFSCGMRRGHRIHRLRKEREQA